jgi:hypothetical protein
MLLSRWGWLDYCFVRALLWGLLLALLMRFLQGGDSISVLAACNWLMIDVGYLCCVSACCGVLLLAAVSWQVVIQICLWPSWLGWLESDLFFVGTWCALVGIWLHAIGLMLVA